MIKQSQIFYITILAIIILVFFYYNKNAITEGMDVTQGAAPEESEADAYTVNKSNSSNMTNVTNKSKVDEITSQIAECQSLITEINQVLPRQMEDISINTVNQTENLEQVGFTITQGVKQSLNPVTNENDETATWEINAVLPRGKKGPPGLKGPKGNIGYHGVPGQTGKIGPQGPWGKDCSNNKCN